MVLHVVLGTMTQSLHAQTSRPTSNESTAAGSPQEQVGDLSKELNSLADVFSGPNLFNLNASQQAQVQSVIAALNRKYSNRIVAENYDTIIKEFADGYRNVIPADRRAEFDLRMAMGFESKHRLDCQKRLKAFGQGLLLYSNENRGKYPADLKTFVQYMLAEWDGAPADFFCANSTVKLPADLAKQANAAEWIAARSDFVYVGGGKTASVPGDTIVAYEKPNLHKQSGSSKAGITVLRASGEPEFIAEPEATRLVQSLGAKPTP
jgi:hypothetical protein